MFKQASLLRLSAFFNILKCGGRRGYRKSNKRLKSILEKVKQNDLNENQMLRGVSLATKFYIFKNIKKCKLMKKTKMRRLPFNAVVANLVRIRKFVKQRCFFKSYW